MSWCTVWKGTSQDCIDNVRGAHDVPSDIEVSTGSFRPGLLGVRFGPMPLNHSGVSTDVLLFSGINLSLVHHYRVFRRGLPHYAFHKDYLTRVFVSQASAMAQCALPSPVPASSGSARNVRPCDAETGYPRKTRRLHGRKHR